MNRLRRKTDWPLITLLGGGTIVVLATMLLLTLHKLGWF